MTGLDILILGVCAGAWLAVKIGAGIHDTRALIRHRLRRRRDRDWIRIVGAPYAGPRAAEREVEPCRR